MLFRSLEFLRPGGLAKLRGEGEAALGDVVVPILPGTGETQENSILKKDISIFKVVKFTTIIALNKSYRKEKVDRDITLKVKKYIVNVGFVA